MHLSQLLLTRILNGKLFFIAGERGHYVHVLIVNDGK